MIVQKEKLNPEKIMSKLFSYRLQAHFLHLQTYSFAKHENFNLYQELDDFSDSIGEFLLGWQAPDRFNNFEVESPYKFSSMTEFLNDALMFTKDLCEYGDEIGSEQLCNMSSELQGVIVKARYFNTFEK